MALFAPFDTGLYPAVDFRERARISTARSLRKRFDRWFIVGTLWTGSVDTVPIMGIVAVIADTSGPSLNLIVPGPSARKTFRMLLGGCRRVPRVSISIHRGICTGSCITLEFLELFVAEGLYDRILTVLTFRPEFKTPWPGGAQQTTIALNRLTRHQAAELMRRKTRGALSEALIEQVYDRTSGVPLFVEEFTKMVQESTAPGGRSDGPTGSTILPAHEIPASLQDLMSARLDRMEGEQAVAQLAATLGREFSYELIAAPNWTNRT